MTRLRRLPMREANGFTRLVNWLLLRRPGAKPPTPAEFLGHHPWVLFSLTCYGAGYSRWRSLPARLKRLVHLRVAMRVGCPS